jgi:hypothetical protein
MTYGVAQHRLRDKRGVDNVVRALHAELDFFRSHPAVAIARKRPALEPSGRLWAGIRHKVTQLRILPARYLTALPRGWASTRRANTTIRFAAL